MARVRATDEVWAEFRAAAGLQPINVLLGELVERHVQRFRSEQLRRGEVDDAGADRRARPRHRNCIATSARSWRAWSSASIAKPVPPPGRKAVSPTMSRTRQI